MVTSSVAPYRRCGEPHTTRIHHRKPLGWFDWCGLQRVWGTLSKFLLDGFPTLRGQLGGPAVDVLIKMHGYESVIGGSGEPTLEGGYDGIDALYSLITPFCSIVSLLLFNRLLELCGLAVLFLQQPARHWIPQLSTLCG